MHFSITASKPGTSAILALAGLALAVGSPNTASAQSAGKFKLDPQGTKTAKFGSYFPVPVTFEATKPTGVKKEPIYVGVPQYGSFQVGDGPRSTHYIAVDEPAGGTWKIYVDLNGDGDLTSSGDGSWSKKNDTPGRVMYGTNSYTVRASWGTLKRERSSGQYGLAFYRFAGPPARMFMYREAALLGTVKIDGKTHRALLLDNDADGIYSKPLDDKGKPVTGISTRPIWLMIDMKDDGKWGPAIDVRSPFNLGEKAYVAKVSPDGSQLGFSLTSRKVAAPPTPAARAYFDERLKVGASPFPLKGTDLAGRQISYESYRGKVLLVDFWATWCGPCVAELPNVIEAYGKYHSKGFEVLGISLDQANDRPKLEAFIKEHKMDWPQIFDGKYWKADNAVASGVQAIPFTLLIGKDGKIAAVGARGPALAPAIEAALKL